MIELIQFPWSPFSIPSRRILEFSGVIRDGAKVVFDDTDDQQIVAKYLDQILKLGLFPAEFEGVQSLLWRTIENEIEGATFRLNDSHYREFVKPAEQLQYLRFKERKFGRGCIDQWRKDQKVWLKKLETGGPCIWSERTRPRFGTPRHVAARESGDMSPHSKSGLCELKRKFDEFDSSWQDVR